MTDHKDALILFPPTCGFYCKHLFYKYRYASLPKEDRDAIDELYPDWKKFLKVITIC